MVIDGMVLRYIVNETNDIIASLEPVTSSQRSSKHPHSKDDPEHDSADNNDDEISSKEIDPAPVHTKRVAKAPRIVRGKLNPVKGKNAQ